MEEFELDNGAGVNLDGIENGTRRKAKVVEITEGGGEVELSSN